MNEEDYGYEYCEHEDNEDLWECKEIDPKHKVWQRTCRKCGDIEQEGLWVEYWKDKFIVLKGKQYRALKSWSTISVCSECEKVVWHPTILWDSKDPSKAITLHQRCAEKIGLFENLKGRSN